MLLLAGCADVTGDRDSRRTQEAESGTEPANGMYKGSYDPLSEPEKRAIERQLETDAPYQLDVELEIKGDNCHFHVYPPGEEPEDWPCVVDRDKKVLRATGDSATGSSDEDEISYRDGSDGSIILQDLGGDGSENIVLYRVDSS